MKREPSAGLLSKATKRLMAIPGQVAYLVAHMRFFGPGDLSRLEIAGLSAQANMVVDNLP